MAENVVNALPLCLHETIDRITMAPTAEDLGPFFAKVLGGLELTRWRCRDCGVSGSGSRWRKDSAET